MTTNKRILHIMKQHMACLMLCLTVCSPANAAVATIRDVDPRDLGTVVILEDPALIANIEDYMDSPTTEEPTQEPSMELTAEPTVEPTSQPSEDPTAPPTVPPTSPPSADYDIQMASPSGWYLNRAVMELNIVDKGSTGWASVCITLQRTGGTVTLIDAPLPSGHIWIDLLENCVVEVVVTDPSGGQHSKKVTVACFDKEIPSLTASVQGEYLNIEAADRQSGVAAVQVNGTTYTELSDGKLKIWLKEYADAYEQLIVQAVDKVGNVSKAIAVANPFYKRTGSPTAVPANTSKPTSTSKPTTVPKATSTPKPTKTPKPSNGSGNSSSTSGNVTVAPTIVPTVVPTLAPTPMPTAYGLPTAVPTIDAGFPFSTQGNSSTRDLLYDRYTNKQFIAIESRSGDVFYIVIDYDKPLDDKGERYETYFLNPVDSRDMLDIVGESATPEPQAVYVTPEPTAKPTPSPVVAQPEKKADNSNGTLILLVLLAVVGGGAFWYFKIRKPSGGKSKVAMKDYDFEDEDEDEDEEAEDDKPDENEDE